MHGAFSHSLQYLHFDLCFGGEAGMPGLSHALVPAQESKRWSFGRLLLLPVIQKGLFLDAKKSRKIRASLVQDSCHGCCLC